jgi:hypothetical protein
VHPPELRAQLEEVRKGLDELLAMVQAKIDEIDRRAAEG